MKNQGKRRISSDDSGFVCGEKSSCTTELCESFIQNLKLGASCINDLRRMGRSVPVISDRLNIKWNEVQNNDITNQSYEFYFKQDNEGDTQLHKSIIMNHTEASLWLINNAPHSNFLNIINDEGQTPLHLAVLSHEVRVVRRLILAGVSTTIGTLSGNTALHLACSLGDMESVIALTAQITEDEKNWLTNNSATSTFFAITYNLELRNYVGQTCLHMAAGKGNVEIVRHLLRLGANVHTREGLAGKTALHIAVENNCQRVVHYLAQEYKSCLNEVTYSGATVYQIAIECKSQLTNDLLILGASPIIHRLDIDTSSDSSSDDEIDTYIPISVNIWGQNASLVSV